MDRVNAERNLLLIRKGFVKASSQIIYTTIHFSIKTLKRSSSFKGRGWWECQGRSLHGPWNARVMIRVLFLGTLPWALRDAAGSSGQEVQLCCDGGTPRFPGSGGWFRCERDVRSCAKSHRSYCSLQDSVDRLPLLLLLSPVMDNDKIVTLKILTTQIFCSHPRLWKWNKTFSMHVVNCWACANFL